MSSTIKVLIFPLVIVASIIIVWMMILPMYDETVRLKNTKKPELESLLSQEKDLQDRTERLYSEETNEKSKEIDSLNYALPSDKEIKDILTQIETIVKKEGMTIETLRVGDSEVKSLSTGAAVNQSATNYNPISGEIGVQGGYGQFKQLLQDFTNLDRIVNIERISVASSTNDSGLTTGKYDLKFNVYWEPKVDPKDIQTAFENKEK